MSQLLYQGEPWTFELHCQGDTCRVQDEHQSLTFSLDGQVVTLEGRQLAYRTYQKDDQVYVWLAGQVYSFQRPQRTASRAAGAGVDSGADSVSATMPGKVLEVRVKNGQAVEAGETLLVMESMKMELAVAAPRDGVVAEVVCQSEQMVALGQMLVSLEALE